MKIRNDDRIAYREGKFSELAEDVKEFLDAEAKPVKEVPKKIAIEEIAKFEVEEKGK